MLSFSLLASICASLHSWVHPGIDCGASLVVGTAASVAVVRAFTIWLVYLSTSSALVGYVGPGMLSRSFRRKAFVSIRFHCFVVLGGCIGSSICTIVWIGRWSESKSISLLVPQAIRWLLRCCVAKTRSIVVFVPWASRVIVPGGSRRFSLWWSTISSSTLASRSCRL